MSLALHWYLPTHGDGRTLRISRDAPQGGQLSRHDSVPAGHRAPTLDYLAQVALAAEQSGFDAALTPTGTWCDDAWITTAALSQIARRLRFIVAFRPGSIAPTLAAQQAAAFQRHTGGRLLLNVVTGGDDEEQRRFGDALSKDARYARTDEFLTILRGAWNDGPFDYHGEHLWAEGAIAPGVTSPPEIYFGGSSPAALRVAARHADVYLTWGEPPPDLEAQIEQVRALAEAEGRRLRFGVRLSVITRERSEDAWAAAEAIIADADEESIAIAQAQFARSSAVGQQRMVALHRGRRDRLEVYPNLWAGLGLLRAGAGTALVGSHAEVADRIAEYRAIGLTEFIFSGYPHVEEAYAFGEGVLPLLRERGLVDEPSYSG